MAVYFWINGGSPTGQWDVNDNWSLTEGGSAAGSYPDNYDDVAIVPASASSDITSMGSFSSQVGMYIQLGAYGLAFSGVGSLSSDLTIFKTSGNLVLNGYTSVYGTCVFFNSLNYGYIQGNCMFDGNSSSNSSASYVDGDCLFSNYANNHGVINGNTLFTAGSANQAYIYGTATFNGRNSSGAYNSGTVDGLELKLPEGYSNPGYTVRPLDILGAGI
jgi:hypothetical protein